MTERNRKFRHAGRQEGFSLIEALVSVVLLGLLGTAVILAVDTNSRASLTLDENVVGANLATSYLEAISSAPYDNDVNPYSTYTASVAIPAHYQVALDVVYTDDYREDGTTVWVDEPPGTKELQKIMINVYRDSKPVFSMCTFKTGFIGF